jgi:hypothetical protein
MKKWTILAAVAAVLMIVAPVFAKNPKSPADYNGLNKGNSKMSHLYLYEKDPIEWTVVAVGAWGKMSFDEDSFVFNGHGLEPDTEYTLIRYMDPWPGSPVPLAEGTSNKGGNIHLSDEMLDGGPKVWLVLSSDFNSESWSAWNPSEYLFEYDAIEGWVWNLASDEWVLTFDYMGTDYVHDMTVTDQTDGTFTGTGGYPSGGTLYAITWDVTGEVEGNNVSFRIDYDSPSTYYVEAVGTIAADGTMSGSWDSNVGQSGTWESTDGIATLE